MIFKVNFIYLFSSASSFRPQSNQKMNLKNGQATSKGYTANTNDTQPIRAIHSQYKRYAANINDTQPIQALHSQYKRYTANAGLSPNSTIPRISKLRKVIISWKIFEAFRANVW